MGSSDKQVSLLNYIVAFLESENRLNVVIAFRINR